MTVAFAEVGDGIHVLRHPVLDVNATLVLGDRAALVVDTLSTPGQAAALVAAARRLTPHPFTVVNTHHHFDHCFGNATLAAAGRDGAGGPPLAVYAHEATARLLAEHADEVRRQAYADLRDRDPAAAEEAAGTAVLAPTHPVRSTATLDVGGRAVTLHHPGRGHTAGDLVVHVPDADVLVAGDLVEESGPPDFGDSHPLEWPETVAALLRLTTSGSVVVPGHGAPMRPDRVRDQHADLARLAWLIRDGHADGATPEHVAARAPFGARPALAAALRGYAELAGDG